MSSFVFTLPAAPTVVSTQQAQIISRRDRLFGKDISYTIRGDHSPDYAVTKAGDWSTVTGKKALSQSLRRRLITDPGEWQTLPDFGVGARAFVKARNTQANRDELERRIRTQFLTDPRVDSIEHVTIRIGVDSIRILT